MVSNAFVKINYTKIGQYLTTKGVQRCSLDDSSHSLFSVTFVIGFSELQSIGYENCI